MVLKVFCLKIKMAIIDHSITCYCSVEIKTRIQIKLGT
jgi:hypothetical protein